MHYHKMALFVACLVLPLSCSHKIKTTSTDCSERVRALRETAEEGNAGAQDKLGDIYYLGQCVPQSYTEAVKWHRKAAEQGKADAQCSLGAHYYRGQGVSQDYAEAAKWFRMAAEQGNELAQSNLGVCYEHGRGVPLDYPECMRWYSKAAEQGNRVAASALFDLYFRLPTSDGGDMDKAIVFAEKTLMMDEALGHYFKGQILKKQKAYIEAKTEYLMAQKADPRFTAVYNQLGYMALETKQPNEALAYFISQVDLAPKDFNSHDSLGDGWVANNRLGEAINAYRKALSLNPAVLYTIRKLGNALEQAGRLEEAVQLYQHYAEAGGQLGIPEAVSESKMRLEALKLQ